MKRLSPTMRILAETIGVLIKDTRPHRDILDRLAGRLTTAYGLNGTTGQKFYALIDKAILEE